jgi:hypothetical protein
MLSASFNPLILLSFFILRLVKRLALSSTPTWSICGDKEKSGIDFIAIIVLIKYFDFNGSLIHLGLLRKGMQ